MILLLQGPPGSGKTTLGRSLSAELGFMHVSKDDIKESLFDSLGCDDVEMSQNFGRAANELLFLLISKNKQNLIIESNFHPELGRKQLEESLGNGQLIEIFISAPDDLLLERFKTRWESGERHQGHQDDLRFDDLKEHLATEPRPIGFSDVIELDGSKSPDEVFRDCIKELQNHKL